MSWTWKPQILTQNLGVLADIKCGQGTFAHSLLGNLHHVLRILIEKLQRILYRVLHSTIREKPD